MRPVSSIDMALLARESPREPNHCGAVLLCTGRRRLREALTFDHVIAGIRQRILANPSLRERLVRPPSEQDHTHWADDPAFDLAFHVRHITVPQPGVWTQLCEEISRIMSQPLDLRRPLWELHLIEGLVSIPRVGPSGFALVAKVHHAAVSDRRGIDLLNLLTSIDVDASERMSVPVEWSPHPPTSTERLRQRSVVALPRPASGKTLTRGSVAGRARARLDRRGRRSDERLIVPPTRFSRPVAPGRLAYAGFANFAEVKLVRRHVANATVNDIVLAVVGGALRRYLSAHHELPPRSLIASAPVVLGATDAIGAGSDGAKRIRVAIRTDIAGDMERLAAISDATSQASVLRAGAAAERLAALSEIAPGQVLGTCLRATAESVARDERAAVANTTVSYVPGPRVPLYFLGCKVSANYGIGTLYDGSGPVHVASAYYDGLTISVLSDRDAMPDIGFYVSCLREAFASLGATGWLRSPLLQRSNHN
jgi:diacylglycerol O-acyltransferase